jgi:thiol:disulfide interchange protein DsbA
MNRRDFALLVPGLGAAWIAPALAQGGPVEGTHYVRLSQPAPVSAPTGKIEVLEFFWYGCPHCNTLEPALEAWAKRLPPDVVFRQVPVAFSAIHEAHQRFYYGLEAIGALESMHRKIFAAIHVQRQRLEKEEDQLAFAAGNGVDRAKLAEAMKSFGVATKMRMAKQLSAAYKIDGVPAIGVHGRYYTAGSLTGSNERALAVADFLIGRVRKGG